MKILLGFIQPFMNWAVSNLTERSSSEILQAQGSRTKNLGKMQTGYCKITFLTGDGRDLSEKLPDADQLSSD